MLIGGDGDDILFGRRGADVIHGGAGRDALIGDEATVLIIFVEPGRMLNIDAFGTDLTAVIYLPGPS